MWCQFYHMPSIIFWHNTLFGASLLPVTGCNHVIWRVTIWMKEDPYCLFHEILTLLSNAPHLFGVDIYFYSLCLIFHVVNHSSEKSILKTVSACEQLPKFLHHFWRGNHILHYHKHQFEHALQYFQLLIWALTVAQGFW